MSVCKLAISSLSLGRASVHDLQNKLLQAEKHKIGGIELFHEDLEYIAKSLPDGLSPENEIQAAHIIRQLCEKTSSTVIGLQPLWYDEGILDPTQHEHRIHQLKHRMQLAQTLGTDTILIPSTFLSADLLSPDLSLAVTHLREAADLGLKQNPPIRFAYEALCWGTLVNTWQTCCEVVRRVDRPNFGICLDTFNIAGRVYADPASPSGMMLNADEDLKASLKLLVKTVNVDKVFLVQIADAERLASPLVKGHEYYCEEQPSRMSWSRNCRLFYGEAGRGACLPVKDVVQAIFHGLGFRGWVIMELFSRSVFDPDPSTPKEHARRAAEAWTKLVRDCNLQIEQDDYAQAPQLPAVPGAKIAVDVRVEVEEMENEA